MTPLKLMPVGTTQIGDTYFCYEKRNGRFTYYLYLQPIDSHDDDDRGAMNKMIATLADKGIPAKDLAKAFDITPRFVRDLRKTLRTSGWRHFSEDPKRRGPSAIDQKRKAAAKRRMAKGASLRQAAKDVGVNYETLRRHLREDRVEAVAAEAAAAEVARNAPDESGVEDAATPADRGTREMLDRAAPMGRGACNAKERVKASKGELPDGTAPRFDEPRLGVRGGAALVAVPGMLANGLLHRVREFLSVPAGYYSLELVLMAQTTFHLLGKTAAEALGRESPAELGKAFGFDRLPCIETFREKIKALAKDLSRVKGWCDALTKLWISQMPEELGHVISLDKHFKICTTRKGRIARNWQNNKKCCLPSLPRLWANALGGAPLFCIYKKLNAGICRCIKEDVVPKFRKLGLLEPDAPNLHRMRVEARAAVKAARLVPNRAERKAAKKAAMKAFAEAFWTRPALTIVFDREGWSPALFRWLAEIGIAIITWRKGDPGEDWPESDFKKMPVPMFDEFGVKCVREYLVAEKKVLLDTSEKKSGGGRKGKGKRKAKADDSDAKRIEEDYLEVREIRRLRSDRKQAVFVTTDFSAPLERIAGALFSRWAQENFFKYAEEWFDLGRSTVHELEDIDPEEPVRNRRRKKIDAELEKKTDLAEKKRVEADALRTLVEECKERASRRTPRSREASRRTAEEEKRRAAPRNLRKLLMEIASIDAEIAELKLRREEEPVLVPVGTLSEKDRPRTIRENENVLVERTKVIAYRTVSWMAGFLPARGDGQRPKKILRSLFNADADIIPEPENGILRVRVVGLPNNAADATIARLFEGLNETNTIYPGTKLRMVYELPDGGKTRTSGTGKCDKTV